LAEGEASTEDGKETMAGGKRSVGEEGAAISTPDTIFAAANRRTEAAEYSEVCSMSQNIPRELEIFKLRPQSMQ
jgi:hypothetical protein